MRYAAAEDETSSPPTTTTTTTSTVSPSAEVHLPADIEWDMLDKSKFFFLGAALFSGVSFALYPIVVLKTRLQVSCSSYSPSSTTAAASASLSPSSFSSFRTAAAIFRHEGFSGFYRGFGTSLTGTIPARALYMGALEVTKSTVGTATVRLGLPEPIATTIANGAAGLSASVAAQVIWTPIDVISQRLMVQGASETTGTGMTRYSGGIDACRKILGRDGFRGLYRGFGVSILTYAPSNAVWWASYSMSQRRIWSGIACYFEEEENVRPGAGMVTAVQCASAAVAGGVSAVVTMPLDTVKTRMQVLDGEDGRGRGRTMTMARTVADLVRDGGWKACFRGLGPRWASMSMSSMTMITTYELVKRLSAKDGCGGAYHHHHRRRHHSHGSFDSG